LPRIIEATHVADFCHESDGYNEINAPQCLQGAHDRLQFPLREELFDRLLKAGNALFRHTHSINHFLQCNLMRWVIKPLLLQPFEMPRPHVFLPG
jgi:hypothetical protein